MAAVAGPNIARLTMHIGVVPFVTTYLALSLLSLTALIVISRTPIPAMVSATILGASRSLSVIVRQPVFLTVSAAVVN